MIITFCNYKGGTGKTTLSLLLATAFEQVGKKVAILDRDGQGTATEAVHMLKRSDHCHIEIIDHLQPGFDVTIIDTAPALDDDLLEAVKMADKVAVVVGQSPNDLWSTQKALEFIKPALKPGIEAKLLFNRIKENTVLGGLIDEMCHRIGAPRFHNQIKDSVAFQSLPLQGWQALSLQQREQVMRLAIELIS